MGNKQSFLSQKITSILNDFPDMIFALDLKMTITFANKEMAKALGTTPEELVGQKCYKVVHNSSKAPEFCPVERFIKNGELKDLDLFLPSLKKHVWITISPVYNENGELVGLVHIARDVTSYKNIEEELKKEKYEKELILESSPTQICLLDMDYNVIWANQLYIKNSLLSYEEVFSKKCYEIWHKRKAPCPKCPVTEAMKTKKVCSRRVEDFMGRWWFIKASPVLNEKNEVVGAVENTIEVTYLKQLEESLKKSEEKFKKLTNSAPIGVLVYKKDKWIYANPYACKITEYSLHELKKMNFWDIVAPEQREFAKDLGIRIQQDPKLITDLEIPIVTKTGKRVWVYVNAAIIELDEGNAVLVSGIDITEKKELETKLKESLKDFKDISLNIPDSIIWKIDWDMEKRDVKNIFIPATIERLWGIPQNIFQKKELWERFCPLEDLQNLKNLWNNILSLSQKSFGIEHRIITPEGKRLWLYTRISVRLMNKSIRVVGYTTNISKRKRMEEKISKSEMEYKTIFESVRDGIVILKECKVVKYNKNFLRLIGFKNENILGKNFWELFAHNLVQLNGIKPKISRFLEKTPEDETPYTFEYSFVNLYGTKSYVEVTLTPYTLGNERYILALIRDITERKKAEEKMRYISLHDSLTGLYNRSFFETEIERLTSSRFYPVTILVADIDGLKLINDSMGHKKGDELIKKCALILKNSLRSSDILARMGGDEFAVLLPNTDQTTAEKIKNRVLLNIEKHNKAFPELPVHLSLGIATANSNKISLETLYRQADDLMYWNKIFQGRKIKFHMLRSFIRSLWDRDYIKDGHTRRIILWCKILANDIGLSRYEVKRLILLAFFHDLGKVAIPDSILFKKGPLTSEEWNVVKKHSEIGYKIASNMPKISEIKNLIIKHHERWNGSGYPFGLKKEDIPIECRVFQVCEAFDVMTRNTPYRKALDINRAKRELLENSGTQFDPYLVKKFLKIKTEESLNEGIS